MTKGEKGRPDRGRLDGGAGGGRDLTEGGGQASETHREKERGGGDGRRTEREYRARKRSYSNK